MSVTWNRLERFSFSKFEIFSLARTWCLVFIITLDVALSELHSDLSVFLLRYEVSPVNIFLSPWHVPGSVVTITQNDYKTGLAVSPERNQILITSYLSQPPLTTLTDD